MNKLKVYMLLFLSVSILFGCDKINQAKMENIIHGGNYKYWYFYNTYEGYQLDRQYIGECLTIAYFDKNGKYLPLEISRDKTITPIQVEDVQFIEKWEMYKDSIMLSGVKFKIILLEENVMILNGGNYWEILLPLPENIIPKAYKKPHWN